MSDLDNKLYEILMTIRTTHEVEHNDNQWTTEFVYTLDEAKAKINRLIVDEYKRGYIQGGIDEILRHDKATKELTEQLGEK